jgi:uncharacterized membrane protein YgcG
VGLAEQDDEVEDGEYGFRSVAVEGEEGPSAALRRPAPRRPALTREQFRASLPPGTPFWKTFRKPRLGRDQKDTLEGVYAVSRFPTDDVIDSMFELVRLRRDQVIAWFRERRTADALAAEADWMARNPGQVPRLHGRDGGQRREPVERRERAGDRGSGRGGGRGGGGRGGGARGGAGRGGRSRGGGRADGGELYGPR